MREALAAYAHETWSNWMRYLFEKGTAHTHRRADGEPTTGWLLPEECVERWQRQLETPYAELPENEKESDRKEADRILAIVSRCGVELEAFPAVVKSKHRCPICGGKKWGCYRVIEVRNNGYLSSSFQWGVANVDLLVEGIPVFYKPVGSTTYYFDECLNCGTVVS